MIKSSRLFKKSILVWVWLIMRKEAFQVYLFKKKISKQSAAIRIQSLTWKRVTRGWAGSGISIPASGSHHKTQHETARQQQQQCSNVDNADLMCRHASHAAVQATEKGSNSLIRKPELDLVKSANKSRDTQIMNQNEILSPTIFRRSPRFPVRIFVAAQLLS